MTILSCDGSCFASSTLSGTVFIEQSYLQSIITVLPCSTTKSYLLGRVYLFATSFSIIKSLCIASTALMLTISDGGGGSGLVPPVITNHLLG